MLTNITPGKYRTRDGGEAVVISVIDVTYDPVIGYRVIQCDGYSYASVEKWGRDGRVYLTIDDEADLIERI